MILNDDIQSNEITDAMSRMKNGKAPGQDRIILEHLKYPADFLFRRITHFDNSIHNILRKKLL